MTLLFARFKALQGRAICARIGSGNMACIPESGGCERRFIDPFITHLNSMSDVKYEFRDCLDVNNRLSPEPECRYVDCLSGRALVVERKTVLWPPDYARNHKNDHFVGEKIFAAIASATFDQLYCLRLPHLIEGRKDELLAFARSVADAILSQSSRLKVGQVLPLKGGRWRASLSIAEPGETDEDFPDRGVFISYHVGSSEPGEFSDPRNLPRKLVLKLSSIYEACDGKFKSYSEDRRILLLQPHGLLEYRGSWWWNEVFLSYPPSNAIEEIWSVDGDYDQGWNFELLFPAPIERETGFDAIPVES